MAGAQMAGAQMADAARVTQARPAIMTVEHLTTGFRRESGSVTVVDDVSFALEKGAVLGIVGESGSGKSMLLRSLMRILPATASTTAGAVLYSDQDLLALPLSAMPAIRGAEIAMVFQDPTSALNPVYTIRRQLYGALASHRTLSRQELEKRSIRALSDVGIPSAAERLDEYPHQFSGGMAQRVVIAIALASDPKILLADEPTTALDVTTQRQILMLLLDIQRARHMTLVLVSHSLGVIAQMCDRVAVMYAGQLVEMATTDTLFREPRHPYTVGLLSCVPDAHGPRGARLAPIPGVVPDPGDLPPGCRFAPRCPLAIEACTSGPIAMERAGPDHLTRCIRPQDVSRTAGLFVAGAA